MSVSLYKNRKLFAAAYPRAMTRYARPYAPRAAITRCIPRRRVARSYVPRTITPQMNRQLKGLIAAKHRDAADVARNTAFLTGTKLSCLSSSTDFATAASGTGLLDTDGDEVLVNSVRLAGFITNEASVLVNQANVADTLVRFLIVWFNKPLRVADASGTLPPISEVLMTDSLASLPVTSASNGGRFVIVSDRTFNMGINLHQDVNIGGYARSVGQTMQRFDYTVKIDKRIKFVANASSGANAGGTYDSDVLVGRVSSGLLVLYTMTSFDGNGAAVIMNTRLNYTG